MKKYKLSDETKTLPWGTVLHRIVATTTFTLACGLVVNAGDVGGWIEKESNLSGNAWVSDDAMVYANARVFGNALISRYAEIYGDARVFGNAKITDNACVHRNAVVCGNAWVRDNAVVHHNAVVSGDTVVYDNAVVRGNAVVYGNAVVRGIAKVYGNAQVSGNAIISDKVAVYGDAQVSGDVQISGDAQVTNASDYIVFKSDRPSGRYFTWTKSNDMWSVGWFYGTGDELIKRAYADNKVSGKHYEACVKSVETMKAMEKANEKL